MAYIESHKNFSANDVTRELFNGKLDKNEKGSMYRLFQAMLREKYLLDHGKRDGLKVYAFNALKPGKKVTLKNKAASKKGAAGKNQSEPLITSQLSARDRLVEKLKEFIVFKSGSWNHDDWLSLIRREDVREFGLPDDEMGLLLEEEKSRFWAQKTRKF
ncbi:hypothetical protein HYY75_12660 [bacterium]|nr:hypothetical protein [bacterium]